MLRFLGWLASVGFLVFVVLGSVTAYVGTNPFIVTFSVSGPANGDCSRDAVVSAKVREFVAIALLAFRGADRESLVAHMRRAIRLGATKEELFEVLEATLVPGGAPTFHR